jgi:hypothetical protein
MFIRGTNLFYTGGVLSMLSGEDVERFRGVDRIGCLNGPGVVINFSLSIGHATVL